MKRKQALLGVLAAVIVVSLAAWLLTNRKPDPAAGRAEAAVEPSINGARNSLRYPEGAPQLTMIESRAIPSSPVPLAVALSARVVYDEDATARIGVPISGRILTLKAAPGELVKAGQVLAEIDSPDVGTAYADLNKAHADEGRKRLILERAKDLAPGEGIAAKDLEAAQADYAQARAETARTELRLKNLNPRGLAVQGQRISLASPLNGVVAERTATPALEVSPSLSAPLFVVTDPKRLWLMIDLPEKLLARMKLGSAVSVESDAYPGERFDAKIVQLGQVIDTNTRRVTVRARLDNSNGRLLPEMFVRASVLQDSGTGVRVPNGALVNRGVYAFVFVQPAPGEFQRRQVRLLTQGSDFSYVGEGLQGGESVVVSGALLLDAELSARTGDRQ
jgi:cobalt-zinc-cadmium efflux system membrane fusion protein